MPATSARGKCSWTPRSLVKVVMVGLRDLLAALLDDPHPEDLRVQRAEPDHQPVPRNLPRRQVDHRHGQDRRVGGVRRQPAGRHGARPRPPRWSSRAKLACTSPASTATPPSCAPRARSARCRPRSPGACPAACSSWRRSVRPVRSSACSARSTGSCTRSSASRTRTRPTSRSWPPGIAEALLATGLGLFAAIPSVIFYNYFQTLITGLRLAHGRLRRRTDERDLPSARQGGLSPIWPPNSQGPAAASTTSS